MNNLKINLHGESWTLKKFECSEDDLTQCLEVASKMKTPLAKAILDPFFYYYLKIPTIASVEHLPGYKISGLLHSPKNQIEILLDGKKIKKLQIKEILEEPLSLFPLFKTEKTKLTADYKPGIYLEEQTIGFIGSYNIQLNSFTLEHLQFHLLEFNEKLLLEQPTYEGKVFRFKKKESLLTYQNSFEIL